MTKVVTGSPQSAHMSAWESAPPFILIAIMFAGMGGLPGAIQHLAYGKPKPVGLDSWDRKLLKRDEALTHYKKDAEGKK